MPSRWKFSWPGWFEPPGLVEGVPARGGRGPFQPKPFYDSMIVVGFFVYFCHSGEKKKKKRALE